MMTKQRNEILLWKSNHIRAFSTIERLHEEGTKNTWETMARTIAANDWNFHFRVKIYAFIYVPIDANGSFAAFFRKSPFRNLFNSLSKINPPAQNMPVRMEQKHGITKGEKKKNRTGGASDRWGLDRRSRSYRFYRDTKIRGWTFDWWTDYISDRICIDYRGGRELPTILDVSIATVRVFARVRMSIKFDK